MKVLYKYYASEEDRGLTAMEESLVPPVTFPFPASVGTLIPSANLTICNTK